MTTAAVPTNRRIPPPRVYASVNRRRSTTEAKSPLIYESDNDHEKCLIAENELRETNRRQLLRIQLLERDYRQLDDDLTILQNERDLLLKQKQILEEELDRSSYHASANVDLHVYTQKLESECRELRSQIALREKEKFELNEIIADFEVQIKQAHDQQEEWRDAHNDLEIILTAETENRQCLETQIRELNQRQKENENQIQRLQNDLDEVIASKQEIVKSNYALVQNAETLREQLRTVRTQAAEVRMICSSRNLSFENLDESLPCLVYDENDEDTPDGDNFPNQLENYQSSLFTEINSLETMPNEMMSKCFNSTTNDIELDVLLAKTTTFSSTISLLNQLINEFESVENSFDQERLINIKILLKRIQDNTQIFDNRFRKLQLLVIASREQQQNHQAELEDFFRLVDKRLISNIEQISEKTSPRLVSILENYEHELERLRQLNRTNDDTIRLLERQLVEQQNMNSRWKMKNTFLEKNQKKFMEKIKELNSERRQLIESSNQKRARRRVVPVIQQIEQPKIEEEKKVNHIFPDSNRLVPAESVISPRVTRSRSLPSIKSSNHGRQSRNDSGVVLNDETFQLQQTSSFLHQRRRMKSNHFVMHTSSHVCYQKTLTSISSNSKSSSSNFFRFRWYFLLIIFLTNIFLSFLIYELFYSQ